MDELIQEIAVGLVKAAVWPGLAAGAVLLLVRFTVPPRKLSPWAVVAAFSVAYCLGHVLAAGRAFSLVPDRNWHWLFYLVPFSGVIGVLAAQPGSRWAWRAALIAVLAASAAAALTGRPGLWATRGLLGGGIFAYLAAVCSLVLPAAERTSTPLFAATGWLAASALAAMIAEQISLTDAELVASAAGALAGIFLVSLALKSFDSTPALAVTVVFALASWACKEVIAESRLWPLLLVPLTLLAHWIMPRDAARSPLLAIGLRLVALVLVIAGVHFLLRGPGF